jgi:hypothetical protein
MPVDQSRAARRSLSMAMAESFVDAVCWWIDRRGAGIMSLAAEGRKKGLDWIGRTDWMQLRARPGRCPLERERETRVSREMLLPASSAYSEDA